MELRQLRHFVAVVEAGNLSVAASKTYLSQPALSRSIKNLETTLGVQLLERKARGVVPTEAGERLYTEAMFILSECGRVHEDMAAIESGQDSSVHLGIAPMFGAYVVDNAVGELRRNAPGIALRVTEVLYPELVDGVMKGTFDVAFTNFPFGNVPKGLSTETIYEVTSILAVGAQHPLARKRAVVPADFAGARWAILSHGHVSTVIEQFMMANGLPPPTDVVATNSLLLIRSLILNEGFISMMPAEVFGREAAAGTVKSLKVSTGPLHRPAGLLYRTRAQTRKSVEIVKDALRAACRRAKLALP
ncbi:MAG: LysR family transcriptional regulator [Rhodospirillaceae bacterium]|nr:LysR family transcriptional regulator [Rhodospirillaceae bacterium]